MDKIRFLWRRKRANFASSFVVPQTTPLSATIFASDYFLQPLSLDQLDEVWELDQRCFYRGEAYSRETFEGLLDSPRSLSYRAVLPSGAMAAFVVAILEDDGSGHITTVGVAPEHRRRGLAFRLLERTEQAFQRRGIGMMRLEVRAENLAAQELYSRAGYFVTQRLVTYYTDGGDGFLMIKPLI